MTESSTLLEVKNLMVSFPGGEGKDHVAVNRLHFELAPGECLGLVGESGSGKSLTALSLMQLLPSAARLGDGSSIRWRGQELVGLPKEKLRAIRGAQMGMVFQEPLSALNPVFTCGEQVAEVLRLHRGMNQAAARTEVLQWFERVRLPDVERIYRSFPHQLSGGQRQRVMIAMALCADPQLFIADEPTTALDVTVQRSILDLIAELREATGVAVLFISHDLGVIKQIADRVMVMQDGYVVESGSVNEVFSNPQHPYTQGLLACRPPLDFRLSRLPVIADFTEGEQAPGPVLETFRESPATYQVRQEALRAQPPILQVRELSVAFVTKRSWWGRPRQTVQAVREVSFDLFPGERLGLVGESGCGKTTLGRTIVRLQEASGGRVEYQQVDLTRLEENDLLPLRPQLQMVFQDPFSSLNPRMSIGEALLEPLRIHQRGQNEKERRAMVERMLERVGLLPEHFDRLPAAFSGGQRQRIGLARAMLLAPEVLICDESVSALDVSVQAQVLNLIRDLQEEMGCAVLFISHDLSVVKFMCDRVLVMQAGSIVEDGPVEEVFRAPKHPYTQTLLAAIPR
ncbi:MAG: ABC transporter ATP-binding protein [Lewinella sp.]|nr:ABC transporter ATP-binding protein [Lewinella sp.]